MTGDCIINPDFRLDQDGYPRVKHQGKQQPAGRLILKLIHGEEAMRGKLACHTCRNRACVNPEHLYIGTAQDNSDDKRKDGTMVCGENHPKHRRDVSSEHLHFLYYQKGWTQSDIAAMYVLSQSTVSQRIRTYEKQLKGDSAPT